MKCKYDFELNKECFKKNMKRIINQIYKLLPMREENTDWNKPLDTLIVELTGMDSLLIGSQDVLFQLLCKLEGLYSLNEEKDFQLYRRTIFECLNLCSQLEKCLD